MPDESSFDVLIAGGGVMGCSIAYYLLSADPSLRVAIYEKDSSYRYNSTVLSDGNTRLQFNLKENIRISQYGLAKLETFADDMSVEGREPQIDFRQQGNLFLADDGGRSSALQGVAQQQALGCPVEWLEAGEVARLFPLLNPKPLAGGGYCALDGTMDPGAVLNAFRDKAIDLGAAYIETGVAAVRHTGGAVHGLQLEDGSGIDGAVVVNAAGAWAAELARTAGIELPVEPVKRQVFVVQIESAAESVYPLIVFPNGLYLIQEQGSRFMVGQSLEDDPVGYHFDLNRAPFLDAMWPALVDYAPAFDRLKITGGWAGLYAVNRFDGNGLLGEWPELKGFYLVNGFSGHGFQQCHAVGRYISEKIRGVEPKLNLSVFSPKRLLTNEPIFEGQGKLV